jgi:hypothetical protein
MLLALPALASPLTDYLKSADTAFREAGLYRRQFAARLGEARQFRGAVYESATGYSRSLKSVQTRLESLTPPNEAAGYHEALRAHLEIQVQNACQTDYQVTTLVRDEELLASGRAKHLEEDYKRHMGEFYQFIGTIDSAEKPSLDRVIELRQQLKPDFELEPTRPPSHRR